MDESGQFIAYELTGEILQQEIEKIYDFQVDIGNWEVIIKKNDAVLFKASRGMKLEEIIEEVFGRN